MWDDNGQYSDDWSMVLSSLVVPLYFHLQFLLTKTRRISWCQKTKDGLWEMKGLKLSYSSLIPLIGGQFLLEDLKPKVSLVVTGRR